MGLTKYYFVNNVAKVTFVTQTTDTKSANFLKISRLLKF